ncbi:MAG: glycerate kinase, partial [Chloroflexi bacterium]
MTLHADMLAIRDASLQAVDPGKAVRRFLRVEKGRLCVEQESWPLKQANRVLLIGAGKAALPMV